MCSISYTIYWCRVYLSRVKCRYNWIVHAECRFRTKMKQSWKGVTGIGSPNTARPELQPFLCRDPLHSCESPFSNWWMFHCVWLPMCSSMWQFHHLSMGSIFETYREQTLRCWNQGNSGRSSSVSLFPNPFFQQIPNKNPIIHPDCYHFKTGWWFQICLFYVHPGEDSHFGEHIFQMGWNQLRRHQWTNRRWSGKLFRSQVGTSRCRVVSPKKADPVEASNVWILRPGSLTASLPLKNDGWKTTVTISFWYGRCSGSILNFQGGNIQLFLLKIVKGLVKSCVSSSMSKLCMESRPWLETYFHCDMP